MYKERILLDVQKIQEVPYKEGTYITLQDKNKDEYIWFASSNITDLDNKQLGDWFRISADVKNVDNSGKIILKNVRLLKKEQIDF